MSVSTSNGSASSFGATNTQTPFNITDPIAGRVAGFGLTSGTYNIVLGGPGSTGPIQLQATGPANFIDIFAGISSAQFSFTTQGFAYGLTRTLVIDASGNFYGSSGGVIIGNDGAIFNPASSLPVADNLGQIYSPNGALVIDQNGNVIIQQKTPATAAATGVAGTICRDANFIYVCIATNSWKRVAIAAW